MKQMYKIYINESPVWLMSKTHLEVNANLPNSILRAAYRGQKKTLLNYIDLLEKSDDHEGIILTSDDVNLLYQDFKSLFSYIKAGGGVVRKEDGKILLIYRLNYWDLPKGKMDPGETIKETALREVTEEVGLNQLVMESKICKTRHTYKTRNKRVLKKTNWYAMYTPNPDELVLEYEENIESSMWVDPKEFKALNLRTYKSVEDTVHAYNKVFQ